MGLPDIVSNGFTFTDGVGHISEELAAIAAKKFSYTNCSAFQIRIAGAKGVLMTKPGLQGCQIALRKSQIKFDANDLTFNVIRCATFGQGFLNRQIITLLYCLGVPESYFLGMQRKAKEYASVDTIGANLGSKKLSKRMTNKETKLSIERMAEQDQANEHLKVILMGSRAISQCIQQAAHKRMNVLGDPLFSSVLYGLQLNNYLNLKKKARILVPDSATLIGVADDLGVLAEDEVFVQLRRDNFKEGKEPTAS
jgi:hypothetical protein